mgnify:CR=1 FL=1
MQFGMTEEQSMIVDTTRAFVEKELYPHELEIERTGHLDMDVIKDVQAKAMEAGLYAANMPEEVGGAGLDTLSWLMYEKELGRANYALHWTCVARPSNILLAGTEEQREKYLFPCIRGEKWDCLAMTEPGAGSDALGSMRTTARKDGGDWVISGEKTWISNGRFADFLICTCNTGEGLTHILVDRKEHGFETRDIPKIGLNAQSTSQVFLDEVRVPVENTIGAEGRGLQQTLVVFERARVHMAMWGIALARRALEESIRYAQERNQHGKQIAGHQMIADKIATMATEIDAARLLTHRAAGMIDRDERCDTECAMAKWYGTEIAVNATRQAVQIHGGNGVTREFIVERLAREAIIGPIPDGTTEIQKLLIARSLTGVAAFK